MVVVVIVAAMLVVVMVAIMLMTVVMMIVAMRGVVVRRMIVSAMAVRVIVFRMRMAGGVGAAFGIERRLDLDDAGAEPCHHRLDDVVAADAQALRHDLGRQMAVAEVPGDPHQMERIGAADFDQRLGGCDHLDQAAVLQHQRVAAAQRYGVFEIEQEFEPARTRHRHPPPVPVVEIENDGIGRGVRPAMLALNFDGADHVYLLRLFLLTGFLHANRFPLRLKTPCQNFSTLPSLTISITVGAVFICDEYSRHTFMCGALPWALRSSRLSQRSTTT
jgi:hypothetical protein